MEVRSDAGKAVISLSDNGIGIPEDLQPRIFGLFVQNARSLDRSEGGLGIGLSVVERLVEMHGGSITATSPGPRRGSTFETRSIAELLSLDGHEVSVAHSADTALENFTIFHPNVVLLDLGLPDMNGYQVAEEMRSAGVVVQKEPQGSAPRE